METDEIIAISAAAIALIAAAISIWQGYLNRAHFRLSVKPHIVIHWANLPNAPVSFTMTNNGLGPAIIKSFIITINGKQFGTDEEESILNLLQKLNLQGTEYSYHLPSNDDAVGVGQKLVLLELKNSKLQHKELTNTLEKMKFKITYSSMYDEKEYIYYDNC